MLSTLQCIVETSLAKSLNTHHVCVFPPGLGRGGDLVVQHGAHPAHELGVDELPRALPPEVGVVLVIVGVQLPQVLGQLLGAGEVVHVDVRVLGRRPLVVLRPGAHGDGDHIVAGRKEARVIVKKKSFFKRKLAFLWGKEAIESTIPGTVLSACVSELVVLLHFLSPSGEFSAPFQICEEVYFFGASVRPAQISGAPPSPQRAREKLEETSKGGEREDFSFFLP